MATVTYTLKNAKAKGDTLIYINFWFGSAQRIRLSSGKKINPEFWKGGGEKKGLQRARKTKEFPTHPEFNKYLNDLESDSLGLFTKYQNEHGIAPTLDEFKKILKEHITGLTKPIQQSNKAVAPVNFYGSVEELIEKSKNGERLNSQDGVFAANTIRGYEDTLRTLKKKWKKLTFDEITLEFYNDFKRHMEGLSVSNNTIGKHIKNVKVFMAYAVECEYTQNMAFKSKYFKVLKEETDAIALSETDVERLFELDLSQNKRLDNVRDLFVLMCMTGLRVSDMKRLNESNIDRENDLIHIKTQKTDNRVAIPLLPMAKAIVDKYTIDGRGLALHVIADQKMNEYIKEVGALIDSFKKPVTLYKGIVKGKRIHKTSTIKDELSNHMGRRTFSTIMYNLDIPVHTIMSITGHKTQKSFFRYIKVSEIEHAKNLSQAFNEHLRNKKIKKLAS